MREYFGLIIDDLVHVVERTYGTHGVGDIGLCAVATRVVHTRGRHFYETITPTCLECVAKEARIRAAR